MEFLLVIINNFNVMDVSIVPFEANSPLVIDSYTVLANSFSFQFFKAIPWWNFKIVQTYGSVYLK